MIIKEEAIHIYDKEHIVFPEQKIRFLASEISYYYEKYGSINIADFFTYLQDKKELLEVLETVLSFEYSAT